MELWMQAGDYVSDGSGGFVCLEGAEALLQRVLFRAISISWAKKTVQGGSPRPGSMWLRR